MNIKHNFTITALPLLRNMINGRKGINLKELFLSLSNSGLINLEDRILNGKLQKVWVFTNKGKAFLNRK
jgi:hypothetical protein